LQRKSCSKSHTFQKLGSFGTGKNILQNNDAIQKAKNQATRNVRDEKTVADLERKAEKVEQQLF
jgi:hypothetical protein